MSKVIMSKVLGYRTHTIFHPARRSQTFAGIACVFMMALPGAVLAAVDVNRANVQELREVKGIGAKTAQRIVVERARGPFESLEHLSERLAGIGPKTIIKLKDAGLCAGTADKPCAKPEAISQVTSKQGGSGLGTEAVTPEILRLP